MPLSLLKRFPLFVWLLFAGLFSVLFPPCHKQAEVASCLGSFVQSCCGEGGALQTNVPGVYGECSQCLGPTGLCPLTAGVLSASTLLRLQVALQGAGPDLRALPRPKLLRFRFSGIPQRCGLGWACVLCLPCLSSSGSQELEGHTLPRCGVPYPLRSLSLSFLVCQSGACTLCLFLGAGL